MKDKNYKIVIAAHQPNFLPNLGYFEKMNRADKFVLITNLQFEKQEGWQQRNRIPSKNGDIWLTVPVKGSQNQLMRDVKIIYETNWAKKQRKILELAYRNTKEKEFLEKIKEIYESKPERLVELNIALIKLIKESLDLDTELIVDEKINGDKYELLINICRKHVGTAYLSGSGAHKYMTEEYFKELEKNNIGHEFMESSFSGEFPYTIIHYILTEGREEVIRKLKNLQVVSKIKGR